MNRLDRALIRLDTDLRALDLRWALIGRADRGLPRGGRACRPPGAPPGPQGSCLARLAGER